VITSADVANGLGQKVMNVETAQYSWHSAEETCANVYLLPEVVEQLRRLYRGNRVTILDIGCGNGFITSKLSELGHSVTGMDSSTDGIGIARAAHPEVRFETCSVYDDLRAAVECPVDCVVSIEVIEHLFFPKTLFEQSHRVLKSGGHLMVSTPYHGYLKNLAISVIGGWDRHFGVNWDGGHIKFFSKATLEQMARDAGFRNPRFCFVGRFPAFWKSMLMIVEK
jgi:2-polyprenyl-3-methyl-5-hydroxy-6-metoxy-1,4-benzoquinol methylase